MTELYWLSRLDSIHNVFVLIFLLSVICISIIGFLKLMIGNDINDPDCFDDDTMCFYRLCKKFKLFVIIMIMSLLCVTFIPKSKDAYIIYGVGSTIEYVKNDSTAKQLPHKAIIALDKYLETLNEDVEN